MADVPAVFDCRVMDDVTPLPGCTGGETEFASFWVASEELRCLLVVLAETFDGSSVPAAGTPLPTPLPTRGTWSFNDKLFTLFEEFEKSPTKPDKPPSERCCCAE